MNSKKNRNFVLVGIVTVILIVLGGLLWRNHVRWPVENLMVEISDPDGWSMGKSVELVFDTNQSYERTLRLGVSLEVNAPGMAVSPTKVFQHGENVSFRVVLTPEQPMQERVVTWQFLHRDSMALDGQLVATVNPPAFHSEKLQTFAEMIQSPDQSIQGSHITVWSTPGEGGV